MRKSDLTLKQAYFSQLIGWIEANLSAELNIDTITDKSGYSKWHMQRLFKDYTGETLANYTRKRRLTQSAVALRKTRLSILDIAVRYGFNTQQHFTRVFKSHFHQTPAAYRRASQTDDSALYCPFGGTAIPEPQLPAWMMNNADEKNVEKSTR